MSSHQASVSELVRLPDGRSLYLDGAGPERADPNEPVVIIEHGLGSSVVEWRAVQRVVARFARVYVYERAGYAPSDLPPADKAPSAKNIAADLKLLLDTAGIAPPYLLVGHSLGGLLVRQFLYDYGKLVDIHGMVLVDPAPSGLPIPEGLDDLYDTKDYYAIIGLDANHTIPDEEYAQLKLDDEWNEAFARQEVRGKPSEVLELAEQIGSAPLLGDARLSVIFCNRAGDFQKLYDYAVQHGRGSSTAREEVRRWLVEFSPIDEANCRKHLTLSHEARFVEADGVRRTHNVNLVDPAWVAAEIEWVYSRR